MTAGRDLAELDVPELDLAERVLDLVRAAAGSAAEAEVLVERRHLALTRFANSYIHQNVADTTTVARLRVHVDGRTSTVSTSLTGEDQLADLTGRALESARLAPPDAGWPGLAPPAPVASAGTPDAAILAATPDDRAAVIRAFVTAAEGLASAGYCSTGWRRRAFVNSAGQSCSGAMAEAGVDAIARAASALAPGGRVGDDVAPGFADGVARAATSRIADLDPATLGARAAAKARAAADPIELPPGRYEVVLEPTAVVDVLEMLALYGFNGKALNERRSFVAIGAQQLDPALTLVDDVFDGAGDGVRGAGGTGDGAGGASGLPGDAEGTPRRLLDLVLGGVPQAVAHDRRSAAQAGSSSTGHANLGWESWGPFPANVALRPGAPGGAVAEVAGPVADSSVAALVARVRRGLLVTDNWYTRVLDPRTLVVTGLTRNGVWLIEGGEVTRPVANFRFTQSYPRALAPGAVLGVGAHAVRLPGTSPQLTFRAPALHLASWNYTGGASG